MASVIVAENCTKVSVVTVADLKETMGSDFERGLLDSRNNIFTLNNTFDKVMYFNYLKTINELAQESRRGKYSCLLDLGYIPILMSPDFMKDSWEQQFTRALEAHKLPYKKLPASSFARDDYTSNFPDIWISKMDGAKLLNTEPSKIRSIDIINAINCF